MSYVKNCRKVPWYYAPGFLLFWIVLFFAVVIPVFFHLPEGLRIHNEEHNSGEFIAERAQRILLDFDRIGPKVVGTNANENITLQFLKDEIAKIEKVMLKDYFEMEVDVQQVSGAYMHWTMVNMYQGLQNLVVKLSYKNNTNPNYLLVNSHFDSKPDSPGTGDDGAMVVIMLEVLRVLVTTPETFDHPIIFLFNGAEENPLQASHGFITQHKWAKNCKALINLDSAGSGHREILFQSGPSNPWLMNYYRKNVKKPYATTLAEELFEANMIPSDTDFRIFKNFGPVPGLDMAHTYNGYVYHTSFDRYNVIPIGTLQATGDNVLGLARGLANAKELEETDKYAEGHTVFYDFLGLFVIFYTETQGKIINACVSVAAIILVCVSLWRMAAKSFVSLKHLLGMFGIIFALQLLSIVLGFGLPILMGVFFDADDRTLTYFTNKWLVIGTFIVPSLFGLAAPTLLYMSYNRNDKLCESYKIQMILHSHCIILALTCFILTFVGLRSIYLVMIAVLFYACALLLNLASTLHDRAYYWTIPLIVLQIMPFLYFTYLFHALLCTLTPMMGRFGSTTNPDFIIGALCALGTVLSMGFLIPLINIFSKIKSLLVSLFLITFIFCMMSLTHLGFPYRAKTNVGRVNYFHVRRVFYEYDGWVSLNETGFLLEFQDRRKERILKDYMDVSKMVAISPYCDKYLMCGFPIFNHRMYKARISTFWLPEDEPVQLPYIPSLNLISKTVNTATNTVRFNFTLSGPPHMSLFIQANEGVTILDWSFLKTMLDQPDDYPPPYHIYYSYGNDNSPLAFHLEFMKSDGQYNVPLFELGIGAHFIGREYPRDESNVNFLKKFPDHIYAMEWPSSYERYIF